MPPSKPADEEDDQGGDFDPEGPDPSEMDYSDEPDLEICPHCRRMISEESDRCPHCGQFITPGEAPLSKRAWVVIVVIAALLIVMILWRGF